MIRINAQGNIWMQKMHGDPNLGLKQPKTDENAQFLAPGKPYRAHMNLKEAKNYLDICQYLVST